MQYLLTIVLLLKFGVSYTQKIRESYYTISSNKSYRFKAINDSVMEHGDIPTHVSRNCTSRFRYATTDKGLIIFTDKPFNQDSSSSYNCDFSFFNSPINLTKIDDGFINEKDSLIYVRGRNYHSNHNLLVLLDDKKYRLDMGKSNGSGIVIKSPKRSRKLENEFKKVYSDSHSYTFERFSGYEAYKRFGYKNVYGVWIINSK